MQTTSLRQRLTSAAAAIGVQMAIALLLFASFAVVRHVSKQEETVFFLPPLSQPKPQAQQKRPMIIDARPGAPAAAPALRSTTPPPAWATPGFALGNGRGGIVLATPPGIGDCKPEAYGYLNASARIACPPPAGAARPDPKVMVLELNRPVPNAQVWQAEIDRRNAPIVIPGGNPLGALFTLLTNPGAFLDKRSYSYATPGNGGPESVDGAETTHRAWSMIPQCNGQLDDTTRRNCAINVGLTYKVSMATSGSPGPATPHVSDGAFAQALAATQARTRSLYSAPVLPSSANAGGTNAEILRPDAGGAAAVPAGPGR